MYFILGALSICQIILFPGLILFKLFRIKGDVIFTSVVVFGLSLLSNYLLVFSLVLLKIYTQWLMLLIIGLEVFLLIFFYRNTLLMTFGDFVSSGWKKVKNLGEFLFESKTGNSSSTCSINPIYCFFRLGFFLLAAASLIWIIKTIIQNATGIFNTWDAIISWNRWAISWSVNDIPLLTRQYPQLLPINWSITYIVMGTTAIQFFAKSIMPLFFLAILLITFDLAYQEKSSGLFLSVFITFTTMRHFLSEIITAGYADIPVAFFCLLCVYIILYPQNEKSQSLAWKIILGAVIAGAAGVTKQTGLYMLLAYPIVVFLWIRQIDFHWKTRGKYWILIVVLIIIVFITAPWYVFKQVQFAQGLDQSEIEGNLAVTSNYYGVSNPLLRIWPALTSLGWYLILFAITIPLFFFLTIRYQSIIFTIILPYLILWSMFLSYDTRNLALAIPFMGIVVGVGIEHIIQILMDFSRKIKPIKVPIITFLVLFILVVIGFSFRVTDDRLVERQIVLQKQIFSPSINEKLYDFFSDKTVEGKILTNYPISYLPGFEEYQLSFWYDDFNVFINALEKEGVSYLLVPGNANEQIKEYINLKVEQNQLVFVFEDSSWINYTFYISAEK